MNPVDVRLAQAVKLVREAPRITAFTGAGIPDFRSPGGAWDRYRIITYQEFIAVMRRGSSTGR